MHVPLTALSALLLAAPQQTANGAPPFGQGHSAAIQDRAAAPAAFPGPAAHNPRAFLLQALGIIKKEAWHSDQLDWKTIEAAALAQIEGAQDIVDTFPAIHGALAHLKALDWHARLSLDEERQAAFERRFGALKKTKLNSRFLSRSTPDARSIEIGGRNLAHIAIPMIIGAPGPAMDEMAARIDGLVANMHVRRPCGWIVDLRGNQGGNMWPMVAGLRRLVQGEELGAVVNKAGDRRRWFQRAGLAGMRDEDGEQILATIKPDRDGPAFQGPIALLFDGGTASSGEATAVAFLGRPNLRSFGQPSAGAATSPQYHALGHGARLFIAKWVYQDRLGRTHSSKLIPDEIIGEGAETQVSDPVLDAASRWLSAHPGCA